MYSTEYNLKTMLYTYTPGKAKYLMRIYCQSCFFFCLLLLSVIRKITPLNSIKSADIYHQRYDLDPKRKDLDPI